MVLLFYVRNSHAQDSTIIDPESRFNSAGIKQGGFVNVNPQNNFGLGIVGVYLGFNFGEYYTNLEVDFLAKGYRKLFKGMTHPGFEINVTRRFLSLGKLDFQAGLSAVYRLDMSQKSRLIVLQDSTNLDYSGETSSLAIGPLVRVMYKLGGRGRVFSELSVDLQYNFDVFGHGHVYQLNASNSYHGYIPGRFRMQRDVFSLELRIGIGQYTRKKISYVPDPELEIDE